jgi:ElaB/YqjD/DUF883 family membrane-anchored ribosome-binding protein
LEAYSSLISKASVVEVAGGDGAPNTVDGHDLLVQRCAGTRRAAHCASIASRSGNAAAKASDGIGLENEVGVLDPDALVREANHGMSIAVPPARTLSFSYPPQEILMATLGTSSNPFPTSSSSDISSTPGSFDPPPTADRTMERVAQTAHQAVDRIADSAAPAVEKLRSGVDQAADVLHTQVDKLSDMQKEWVDAARTAVRDHPLASVAIGVAAGMLLTRLLSTR